MNRKSVLTALIITSLAGCTMAAKDLKNEIGALVVPNVQPPEKVAMMIGNGISDCAWGVPVVRQSSEELWMVTLVIGDPAMFGPTLSIEVGPKSAIIAPRFGYGWPAQMVAIIAEWVEKNTISRCLSTAGDIEKWDRDRKQIAAN